MRLVGRYDSPFVRRVGVSLHVLQLPFELLPLSPFSQATNLRRYTSIGRMPALVLDSGEALIESAAILDYLDELVGPNRALLPTSGPARRRSLRIVASATAACEKAIAINYERRRPADKVFDDWISRCHFQLEAALTECEHFLRDSPEYGRLKQTDITTACMFGYVRRVEPALVSPGRFPMLELLSRDCELHSAFIACPENAIPCLKS